MTVGRSILSVWVALRIKPLGAILDARARLRSAGAEIESIDLDAAAQTFAAARRWWPIKRNCLLDTLAIDQWLGIPKSVKIVFGVIANPFEAHCWAQSDRGVLNDSYDRVSRFEPILAV